MKFPLSKPDPDFRSLEKVILGEKRPDRVHFVELLSDPEVVQEILNKHFDYRIDFAGQHVDASESKGEWGEEEKERMDALIDFYYRLGYDSIHLQGGDWVGMPQFKHRQAKDTAQLSRGDRTWVEEGGGIIKDWSDFESIDWEEIKPTFSRLEYAKDNLPGGMKITVGLSLFEVILESFLGYEDLFKLSIQKPDLVEEVFEVWGEKVYGAYEEIVSCPQVGAIFHADDLGYKKGTMMSPDFLRERVFPWFSRYASLAHQANKTYWYHCCGNRAEIMEDLIQDVGVDALHSFQDTIEPVTEFVGEYGDRVAALGGVEMDKLARYEEDQLREYVREVLGKCMPGRYALGSGNTVANYVPVENYFAMLEEGLGWEN